MLHLDTVRSITLLIHNLQLTSQAVAIVTWLGLDLVFKFYSSKNDLSKNHPKALRRTKYFGAIFAPFRPEFVGPRLLQATGNLGSLNLEQSFARKWKRLYIKTPATSLTVWDKLSPIFWCFSHTYKWIMNIWVVSMSKNVKILSNSYHGGFLLHITINKTDCTFVCGRSPKKLELLVLFLLHVLFYQWIISSNHCATP